MKASFYKKTLSFILSLLMLCLFLGMVAFASNDSKVLEDDSALTPSVFQEQAAAQDAYSKLCASFKLTEDGSYVYPDDYAGAWYENGILHIVTIDDDAIATYKEFLSEYDCVHYEIADYSLNMLNYIRSSLYDTLRDEYAAVSHYVDQKTNKINVGFLNVEKNRANINSIVSSIVKDDNVLKSVVSEDFKVENMFVFCEGEIIDAEATIYGGMEINRGSSSGSGRSIGVSGTFISNNVTYNGIITAGHNLETSGSNQILYRNGSEFGRVSLLMWKDNGNGDWACVRMTSGDTLTNKIYGSSSAYTRNITNTIDDLAQGMSLMKYGFSSEYAEATVNAQDQTITDSSGKTIKGLTKATLTSGTSSFLCVACTSSQNNSDVAHNDEEPVSNNEQKENSVPNNPERSVELIIKVEPEEIALHDIPKFITIEVMNTSKDMEYRGGQGYSIDYYDGSDWNKIIIPAVYDEMIVIEPSGTLSFDYIQLQPDQYKYVSGKYRVCFNGEYYAEFTIK